jgi:hypothetical protein
MIADIWPTKPRRLRWHRPRRRTTTDPAAATDRWEWVVLIMISWLRGDTGTAVGVRDGF